MIDKRDITFRYTRGQGPGGQRKNKVETCVIATHTPTGLEVRVDGRNRRQNQKEAVKLLTQRVREAAAKRVAKQRKARRDHAIKNEERIRTYDYSRNLVTDHRTGKTAPIKEILEKAKLEKLR
jgi:protein subunit release factor A